MRWFRLNGCAASQENVDLIYNSGLACMNTRFLFGCSVPMFSTSLPPLPFQTYLPQPGLRTMSSPLPNSGSNMRINSVVGLGSQSNL